MTSTAAPTYYFNGIAFNASYFSSSNLNSYFISKRVADYANGIITFNSGLNSALVNSNSGTLDITATNINLNSVKSNIGKVGNTFLEVNNGGTSAMYIDFHSSNTASDYDARIASGGGSSTSGQANLDLIAQGIFLNTTSNVGQNYIIKYGNIGIETGINSNNAISFIDFHSSNTTSDYDCRISSTGGTSTSGQATLELTANIIKVNGSFTVPTGNITTINTVNTDTIQPYYSSDNINLYTTGTGVITLGCATNALYLATPIVPQALTYTSPDQIGWSQSVSFFTDTAFVGPGTYYTKTSQSIISGTQLPIGTYLITFTGSTIIGTGVSGGTSTQAGAGYFLNNTSYGSTSGVVITVNTSQATHPLLARTAGQYYWNYSLVVKNTLTNAYIYGHVLWSSTAAITGTVQNIINCYSLTRIA